MRVLHEGWMCLVLLNKTVNIVHTSRLDVVFGHILTPLKGRDVNWLHFAIQVLSTFYIRALWRSALSATVPECHKYY